MASILSHWLETVPAKHGLSANGVLGFTAHAPEVEAPWGVFLWPLQ